MLLVRDIMTRGCHCLTPEQSLSEAIGLFEQKGISGGPVVDPEGLVVGHLSHTGISRNLARINKLPEELKVAEVMDSYAFQAYEDDTVRSLVETMLASRIHRMIITDEEGRPVGIVTSMDLMGCLCSLLQGQVPAV